MKRRLRKAQGSSQQDSFNWTAVSSVFGVMVIWVLVLVWSARNEPRYLLLDHAMPLLMVIAGITFSFGWKTISDEITKVAPTRRWGIYYWIGLASPMLALLAWVLAAIVLHYLGL